MKTEQFIDNAVIEIFHLLHRFNKKAVLPTELAYPEKGVTIDAKIIDVVKVKDIFHLSIGQQREEKMMMIMETNVVYCVELSIGV